VNLIKKYYLNIGYLKKKIKMHGKFVGYIG